MVAMDELSAALDSGRNDPIQVAAARIGAVLEGKPVAVCRSALTHLLLIQHRRLAFSQSESEET